MKAVAKARPRRLLEAFAAAVPYTALAAFYMRPIWRVFRTHLTPDAGDSLFNLYVLEWVMRQLRLGLPDLWNANFFWPVRDTLTLSDHLIGPSVQALAIHGLAGGSIGAYNLLLFASLPLSGLATFWVLRRSGLSPLASFAGGLAFAFSPYRWSHLNHFQVFLVQWIPLVLWFWDRLLAEPRARHALPFLAFYALHVTGGNYLAYMLHFPLAALALNRGREWRSWLSARGHRVLLLTALLAGGLLVAVFHRYLGPAHGLDLARGTENYRDFGANAVALLTPAPLNSYFAAVEAPIRALAPGQTVLWEKSLFPGLLAGVLALAGAVGVLGRHRAPESQPLAGRRRAVLVALVAAAAAAFVAADLYSLGWWFDSAPGVLMRPGAVYSMAGLAFAIALAGWFVLSLVWRRRSPLWWTAVEPWRRGVLLVGVVCLALSFPVVYEPLSELMPGMRQMRVPARFYAFTTFATAFFAAVGLDRLRARLTPRAGRTLAAAVAAAMAIELAPAPLPWHRIPTCDEFPPVYHWLAGRDDVRALLELPHRNSDDELRYLYFSTAHWKPIANGYSGHFPPSYLEITGLCCDPVPENREVARRLRRAGISHLVVHPVWRNPAKRWTYRRWLERLAAGEMPWVRQVYADDQGDRVFELLPADGQAPN